MLLTDLINFFFLLPFLLALGECIESVVAEHIYEHPFGVECCDAASPSAHSLGCELANTQARNISELFLQFPALFLQQDGSGVLQPRGREVPCPHPAQHRAAPRGRGGCGAPGGPRPAAGCLGMPPSPSPSPRTRPPGGAVAVPAMLGDGRGVRGPEVRFGHVGMSGWNRARGNGVLRCAEREAVPSPTSGLLQSALQLTQTAVPHPSRFPAWPSVCRGRMLSSPRRSFGGCARDDGARGFRTASAPANGNVVIDYYMQHNSFSHRK